MMAVDIVVVGAGPVGLLTAIELTLGGASVLVLERLVTPSRNIKALGIGPLAVEALQRRGMAAAIDAEEERNASAINRFLRQDRGESRMAKFSGHFAFLPIRREVQREPQRRMRAVDQQGLEAILSDRARALGIEVRRGCAVTGYEDRADGVAVTWTSSAGACAIRCAYLVGCDGGRSTVRKLAGFGFPGTPPTLTMYQAIVDLDTPSALPSGWHRTSEGVFAHGPFPRRLFMLDFSGPPHDRQAPVTREEIEAVLRRISGTDIRVRAMEVGNRWADNTRLAETYRKGRVLLAGDAAHVHAPFGGQGLSLGLVDAANLGWKLAAVVRGDRPESLLDTYTAERRPVAEAVLANTLAQVAIMRPDPQSGAMRDIMARLMQIDDIGSLMGEMMNGLATRYDLNTAQGEVGRLIGDRPVREAGPGGTLYDIMREGRAVLLDASREGMASRLAAPWERRVIRLPDQAGPSMLIRPDGCVAWAASDDGTGGLVDALHRWFGAPGMRVSD